MRPADPKPGDLLIIDRAASVQFASGGFLFRVIAVDTRLTYNGWVWLTGYVIDRDGRALDKREIFVRRAGLRPGPLRPGPLRPGPRTGTPRRGRG